MIYFFVYLILVNCAALIVCGMDKRRAVRHRSNRIPESRLFFLSFIGGAAGMLLGMLLFRHKTRHIRFIVLVPLLTVLQIAAVILGCTFQILQ